MSIFRRELSPRGKDEKLGRAPGGVYDFRGLLDLPRLPYEIKEQCEHEEGDESEDLGAE